MEITETGYTKVGYRIVGDDVWYPQWFIQVCGDGPVPVETVSRGKASPEGVLETVERLSKKYPDRVVTCSASARTRITMQGGVVLKEFTFSEFYYTTTPEEILSAKIFDEMLKADSDGMGKYDL